MELSNRAVINCPPHNYRHLNDKSPGKSQEKTFNKWMSEAILYCFQLAVVNIELLTFEQLFASHGVKYNPGMWECNISTCMYCWTATAVCRHFTTKC